MDLWGRKHPKPLDEEMRYRWRALEEKVSKHAVASGWKEERSLDTQNSQHGSIMSDKAIPAARALSSMGLDLQVLGQIPGRPLRILSTSFILLPTLSLALATWRAPS